MEEKKKALIIFDTDIGGDCDDAGALAMTHRLCDMGEAELLAVTGCYESPYVAGCIDAINTYYNRKVPVGVNYGTDAYPDTYTSGICNEFPSDYPAEKYNAGHKPEDAVRLIRRTLAAAEDKSISLVATGPLSTLGRLIKSGADDVSSLTGAELVEKKVLRTVIMGGRFSGTWPMPVMLGDQASVWEYNIRADIPAAQTVCDMWPGELVFSSFEIPLDHVIGGTIPHHLFELSDHFSKSFVAVQNNASFARIVSTYYAVLFPLYTNHTSFSITDCLYALIILPYPHVLHCIFSYLFSVFRIFFHSFCLSLDDFFFLISLSYPFFEHSFAVFCLFLFSFVLFCVKVFPLSPKLSY